MGVCDKKSSTRSHRGVDFIKNHIIETTSKRFDDFAGGDGDKDENQLRKILGI